MSVPARHARRRSGSALLRFLAAVVVCFAIGAVFLWLPAWAVASGRLWVGVLLAFALIAVLVLLYRKER